MVTKETPLGLQFPFHYTDVRYAELKQILGDISAQLTNHSIFYSGGTPETTEITILKVVDEQVVLEHAKFFLRAIEKYATIENRLVTRLAAQLNFPVDQISETWIEKLDSDQMHGYLGDEWKYYFHGFECCFENIRTGQIVDATLRDYGKTIFIPDPYFLAQFIETTSSEQEISRLVDLNFHDMGQVLRVLVKYGYLSEQLL
jgi:hypothetical protein